MTFTPANAHILTKLKIWCSFFSSLVSVLIIDIYCTACVILLLLIENKCKRLPCVVLLKNTKIQTIKHTKGKKTKKPNCNIIIIIAITSACRWLSKHCSPLCTLLPVRKDINLNRASSGLTRSLTESLG